MLVTTQTRPITSSLETDQQLYKLLVVNSREIFKRARTMKLIEDYFKVMRGYKDVTTSHTSRENVHLIQSEVTNFDWEEITLPLTAASMHLINTIYPNLHDLKVVLNPETQPGTFLTEQLLNFRSLRKLTISLVDGSRALLRAPIIAVEELELNFKIISDQKRALEVILKTITATRGITIIEGKLTLQVLHLILKSEVENVRLRNPILEEDVIMVYQMLRHMKIRKFECVITHEDFWQHISKAREIMYLYLLELPHKNLKELTFTLLPTRQNYDYIHIVRTLKELEQIIIFILPYEENLSLTRLHPLLTYATNICITLVFVTKTCPHTERKIELPIPTELSALKSNINIERMVDPYINYPMLKDRNKINLYPGFYRTEKYRQESNIHYTSEDIKIAHKLSKGLTYIQDHNNLISHMNTLVTHNTVTHNVTGSYTIN